MIQTFKGYKSSKMCSMDEIPWYQCRTQTYFSNVELNCYGSPNIELKIFYNKFGKKTSGKQAKRCNFSVHSKSINAYIQRNSSRI